MTGVQLQTALSALFGENWRVEAAAALKVSVSTIDRQTNGVVAVSGPVEVAVNLMMDRARAARREATEDAVRRQRMREHKAQWRARRKEDDDG